MLNQKEIFRGRGSQINPHNKFHLKEYVVEFDEGIDEVEEDLNPKTKFYVSQSKSIVNKVNSPDIPFSFSINPYQGCEHGCAYCYARESHQYWGFSPGIDFESQIIVKTNAADLLEKFLRRKNYVPTPIMLSGNTDCYQPVERKLKITRKLLEVFLKYQNPVSIISKNYTVLRDLDLLKKLASKNLVHVTISITSLDQDLQAILEPRTASPFKRLKVVKELAENDIPVSVILAPIIPGVNDHEIPAILETTATLGARNASYIIVRLNGSIKGIFENWLNVHMPLRKDKVISGIEQCHGGQTNDSRFGKRMAGEGNLAEIIKDMFTVFRNKHYPVQDKVRLDTSHFKVPVSQIQPLLF